MRQEATGETQFDLSMSKRFCLVVFAEEQSYSNYMPGRAERDSCEKMVREEDEEWKERKEREGRKEEKGGRGEK